MSDREKVIKNLEEMLEESKYNDSVQYNPWADTETLEDALALLKAQEPHIMSKADFENNPNADEKGYIPVWVEYNRNDDWGEWWKDQPDEWAVLQTATVTDGESKRYWSGKPTKEQRKAVKWDG